MKKIILLILLITPAIFAKCQIINQGGYTGVYRWNDVVLMQRCDGTGKLIPNTAGVYSISRSRFTVYNIIADTIVIKFYDYTMQAGNYSEDEGSNKSDNTGNKKFFKVKDLFFKYNYSGSPREYDSLSVVAVNTRNYGDEQIYYRVLSNMFRQKAQKISRIAGSLALGAINYPFKYRFAAGKADFSGAFNLGAAIGYKFPHDSLSRWTYTCPFAVSITSINIDSAAAMRNQTALRSTNNFSAISLACGVIAENNKIQIGLFVGIDRLSRLNNLQYEWIYQNKPWFSVGFGYALFSEEKQSTNTDTSAQQ